MSAANTTLNSAIAAGFDQASTRDLMIIAAYAASNLSGGSGVESGNYAGGQPNFTPASGFAVAVDTSNKAIWIYSNGAWA